MVGPTKHPTPSYRQDIIVSGSDFYSSPRFSSSGHHLAYIEWNHPNMPWTHTGLHVGSWKIPSNPLSTSSKDWLSAVDCVGGKDIEESISQLKWKSENQICFVSDRSGFYNPYYYDLHIKKVEGLLNKPMEAEFAGPEWNFNR